MTVPSHEQRSLERQITTTGQLLVEGHVPEMFFREMIAACGLSHAVEARTFGDISKANLQAWLEMFTQKAAFKERVKRVGIIRDAEGSTAASAFESVRSALREAKLPPPSSMNKLEGSPLAVGIFILPNCQDAGMLESLCLTAVSEIEKTRPEMVLPCVNEFFACLRARGRNPEHPTKAQLAGYALACDVIDPQLGRAAQKGCIPWQADAFAPLRTFIKSIAGE